MTEAQQLETLLELQRDLALEANIDKVLWRITLAATFMLDADRATLYIADQAKNELWSRVLTERGERGESVAALRELRLPLDGRSLAAERLRVVKVAEEERHRLARDLHDGVAQTLANAALGIELAQRRAKQDVAGAMSDLGQLRGRLLESQKGLRDILFALRPLVLEDGGLSAAVRALAERIDGTNGCRVVARRVDAEQRFKPEIEAGAFTVIREAANNAIKTGRAPQVSLDLYEDGGAVVAMVEDNGKGFDIATTLANYASRGSLGLLQMRESARLIGAQLSLDSSPGQGTRVRLRIPT